MIKEIISTTQAPAALGPYSQGTMAMGHLVFVSGQVPVDPATGKIVDGGVEAQAEQSCKNVMAVLKAIDLDASNVFKTTVFITNMADFPKINEVYKKYFTEPCPARSCVQVSALPLGAQVEIEAIAVRGRE